MFSKILILGKTTQAQATEAVIHACQAFFAHVRESVEGEDGEANICGFTG
jgi:hypothetical protein